MPTRPRAFLVLLLSAGAVALAPSVLAQGLPGPPLPLPTVLPSPTVAPPLPTPTSAPSVPGLPTVPLPTVPGLRLPGLPAAPGTAAQKGVPRVATVAEFGYLPWGHFVDDGLGVALPPLPAIPTPHFTLPPATGYDKTGYDQTDYPIYPKKAARAVTHGSAAGRIASALAGHLLLDVLAVLTLAAAGVSVVVARRRGLL